MAPDTAFTVYELGSKDSDCVLVRKRQSAAVAGVCVPVTVALAVMVVPIVAGLPGQQDWTDPRNRVRTCYGP